MTHLVEKSANFAEKRKICITGLDFEFGLRSMLGLEFELGLRLGLEVG